MLGVLLLSAGKWDWWEAWAYSGLGILVLLGSRTVLIKKTLTWHWSARRLLTRIMSKIGIDI